MTARAGRTARALRAVPFLAALAAVATVDADLRGPLAGPADVWIAGHAAEAARRLRALPADAVRGLRLPSPDDDAGGRPFDDAARRGIERFLLESLRDDDARLLYSASWWRDRGRTPEALAALRQLEARRPTDAVRRLREAWETP